MIRLQPEYRSLQCKKSLGVSNLIRFSEADATRLACPPKAGSSSVTRPTASGCWSSAAPSRLYQQMGRHWKDAAGWKQYIISSEPEFEHYYGKKAAKKRKLYNGMIKCDLYMYL